MFVTGVKTVAAADAVPAKITLAYDGGAPAVGLQTGTLWSCIGYRDLRYRIASVSADSVEDDESTEDIDESHGPSSITVIRLTDIGAEDEGWLGFDDIETNTASITLDGSTTETATSLRAPCGVRRAANRWPARSPWLVPSVTG